jgi:hypothetical protein
MVPVNVCRQHFVRVSLGTVNKQQQHVDGLKYFGVVKEVIESVKYGMSPHRCRLSVADREVPGHASCFEPLEPFPCCFHMQRCFWIILSYVFSSSSVPILFFRVFFFTSLFFPPEVCI